MNFFRVKGPRLWGDYGDMLMHGMTAHLPRKEGLLQLERTAPFMPPITFPGIGDVIVTDEFRLELNCSQLFKVQFRPVLKARIVEYHWESWDRIADDAKEHPESGEPEDYILSRPHSTKMADDLGEIWQVLLPEGAAVDTVSRGGNDKLAEMAKAWQIVLPDGATLDTASRGGSGKYEIRVDVSTWNGNHLFWGRKRRDDAGSWIIVSECGKKWLEEHVPEWCRFETLLEK